MGTDPSAGSSPHFYEVQAGPKAPSWLASRQDVDYPSRVSSAPTYGRVDGSYKLHSFYLTRWDLVQRHEASKQNIIHVH